MRPPLQKSHRGGVENWYRVRAIKFYLDIVYEVRWGNSVLTDSYKMEDITSFERRFKV